jgi:glyoxylase-like metal-dependent hydrolase (beta-lactamase superfamily II)
MRIHALELGHVAIKQNQINGKGGDLTRAARTMFGREWAEPVPILAWLIEHPEGLIVVDAGETARAAQPGYFPAWHPYYRLAVRMHVTPEQEVGPQIRALGLDPGDVRTVVMTHMHTDHAGGIEHFPNSEFLLSARELAAYRSRKAKIDGYLPHRAPEWFAPSALKFDDGPYGGFEASQVLTEPGDVRVISTPGHTPGHVSVLVREGDGEYVFIAGDASYNEKVMLDGKIDGVNPKSAVTRATLAKIREFTSDNTVTYLPTHDHESPQRLKSRTAVGAATRLAPS